MLGLKVSGEMKVVAESGSTDSRIDLLLEDEDHFIIIENKVCDAEEQEHQIYRYVYEIARKKYMRPWPQIYLLYLNSSHYAEPSLQSITGAEPGINVKEKLEAEENKDSVRHFAVKNFAGDVYRWLCQLLDTPSQSLNLKATDNKVLESALIQYKDYLERYFELNDEYKTMNTELIDKIKKHYGLEHGSPQELLERVDNTITQIDELKKRIVATRADVLIQVIEERLKKDFKDIEFIHGDYSGNPQIGFSHLFNNGRRLDLKIVIYRIGGGFCGVDARQNLALSGDIQKAYEPFSSNSWAATKNWPVYKNFGGSELDEAYESFRNLIDYTLNLMIW